MTLEDAIKEEIAELQDKIDKLQKAKSDLERLLKKAVKLGTP